MWPDEVIILVFAMSRNIEMRLVSRRFSRILTPSLHIVHMIRRQSPCPCRFYQAIVYRQFMTLAFFKKLQHYQCPFHEYPLHGFPLPYRLRQVDFLGGDRYHRQTIWSAILYFDYKYVLEAKRQDRISFQLVQSFFKRYETKGTFMTIMDAINSIKRSRKERKIMTLLLRCIQSSVESSIIKSHLGVLQ